MQSGDEKCDHSEEITMMFADIPSRSLQYQRDIHHIVYWILFF